MASLIDIKDLRTHFFTSKGTIKAVDGLDLSISKGETTGLVGESGCGKSMASLSILRLVPSPPGRIVSGSIIFKDKDLLQLPEAEMRKIRGNEISMVFQEPMTSLNPLYTVGDQILEGIKLHRKTSGKEAMKAATSILELVNIPYPERRLKEYPHQLSGGMRQRVMIAMALSCEPDLLIADEPTTALDVTIQAKILDLLLSLKEKLGLSVLFITHDLSVIAQIAQRVYVMYAGKIVESGDVEDIFKSPLHPYTKGLLNSIPTVGKRAGRKSRLKSITGTVPDPYKLPPGCYFQPRCEMEMDVCKESFPPESCFEKEHRVKCYLYK